jgi:hypothetical protein
MMIATGNPKEPERGNASGDAPASRVTRRRSVEGLLPRWSVGAIREIRSRDTAPRRHACGSAPRCEQREWNRSSIEPTNSRRGAPHTWVTPQSGVTRASGAIRATEPSLLRSPCAVAQRMDRPCCLNHVLPDVAEDLYPRLRARDRALQRRAVWSCHSSALRRSQTQNMHPGWIEAGTLLSSSASI